MRAGPNGNYAVIAFVSAGASHTHRSIYYVVQIAPAGTPVWISEDYIQPVITETVYLDEVMMDAVPELDLTLDPSLPQGVKDLIEGVRARASGSVSVACSR